MDSSKVISLDEKNIMHTYSRQKVVIDHGKGSCVYDVEGKRYIDLSSGIGVNSLGYGDEKWVEAVSLQASRLAHISNLYYTEPDVKVAGILTERTGLEKVFFANSGAEANEGMIKLARKYSFDKYGKERGTVITLRSSFHGRTLATLKATGQDHFHSYFFPFPEGFRYADPDSMESLKAVDGPDVCAIMFELVQGEGGVNPLSPEYVEELCNYAKDRDYLILVDEVQTGIGRTGSLFAFQKYGIEPDVVSFAKGIASGLPFGGFIANRKTAGVMGPGLHGSTFGGNPVAAAAAGVVLERLTGPFLKEVERKGEVIRSFFSSLSSPLICGVRGLGLMIGVGLEGVSNAQVRDALQDKGVLVLTAGRNTMRLLPPLVITDEELEEALEKIAQVFQDLEKEVVVDET